MTGRRRKMLSLKRLKEEPNEKGIINQSRQCLVECQVKASGGGEGKGVRGEGRPPTSAVKARIVCCGGW